MNHSSQFTKRILGFFGVLLLLAPLTVLAQTKVVVIPLGDDAKPLKNIITVAKANGNFTNPVTAVNSITDASADNPYLVVIGPGVYTITQTLVMKPYVDITGSGENVTKLTGAISTANLDAFSAIVSGANDSVLSSLTVENTGGNSYSIGIYNSSGSAIIANVNVLAKGGITSIGILNYSALSPTMRDVTSTAEEGTSSNIGVFNISSSPTMTGVTATATGGNYGYGVSNEASSPTMVNVAVKASGAKTENNGIYNNDSSPIIRRSTMEGNTRSLSTQGGTATVSQSTLIGSVWGGSFNKCVACDNNGTALGTSCQ
jgi:hypothetical protein